MTTNTKLTAQSSQYEDDFWPVDEKASRKQLIAQIGQMNFRLSALRQENAGLIKRAAGQAEALQNYQRTHESAPVTLFDAAQEVK